MKISFRLSLKIFGFFHEFSRPQPQWVPPQNSSPFLNDEKNQFSNNSKQDLSIIDLKTYDSIRLSINAHCTDLEKIITGKGKLNNSLEILPVDTGQEEALA